MLRGAILIIIAILIVAGGIYLWKKDGSIIINTNTNTTVSSTTLLTYSSSTQGITFRYPRDLGTAYISTPDWPPMVQLTKTAFSCTEAGTPTARAGQTSRRTIGGKQYCVTEVTEGAAGSIYSQYAYAFANGTSTAILTFTVRRPQCMNYSEPEQTACKDAQADLNIDNLVDGIVDTLNISATGSMNTSPATSPTASPNPPTYYGS